MPSILSPGTRLGQYEIEARLGAGSIGDVYRAHDTVLQRPVSITIVDAEDAQTESRWLGEARAASVLNHPNICTIYEVGQIDDTSFVAAEFVDGKTLADLTPAGGMPRDSVVRYGSHVAGALAHAHEQGIVHGALTPHSVVVTTEGRAKVRDFGLDQDPHAASSALAHSAPEMLRGEDATARSDLWGLGVLLYEMACGTPPFRGTTDVDLRAAILRDQPDPLPPRVGAGIRVVVERCLNKEPEQRYADAGAVEAALEAIHSDSRVTSPVPIDSPTGAVTRWRLAVAAGGLAVAAALIAGGLGYFSPSSSLGPGFTVPRLANPVQFASNQGAETNAAWSPDGQMLAYGDGGAIWVKQIDGGQAIDRGSMSRVSIGPVWSPDGREIAFRGFPSGDGSAGGVYVMPALAGAARKVAGPWLIAFEPPQYVEGGTALAYPVGGLGMDGTFGGGRQRGIAIVPLAGGERHILPGSLGVSPFGLAWSPDRRFLAYGPGGNFQIDNAPVAVLRVEDGETIEITDGEFWNKSIGWSSDGQLLYFISDRGGARDLWQQRIADDGRPVDEPQRISVGIGMADAAFSPDGSKLAYTQGGRVENVWRVPILDDRVAKDSDFEQVTFDLAATEEPDVSPDGTRLVVASNRRGRYNLWTLPAGGGEMQQLTFGTAVLELPRWSADGQRVSYTQLDREGSDIWVMSAAGGEARQVTSDGGRDNYSNWSPDGTQLVFLSERDGVRGLWTVNVETREERFLAEAAFVAASWSPDGEWIAYSRRGQGLWRIPAAGGEPEQLAETGRSTVQWAPDGRTIYARTRRMNLVAISVDDLSERTVYRRGSSEERAQNPDRPWALSGTLSTDGRYLYSGFWGNTGDIWIADVVYE